MRAERKLTSEINRFRFCPEAIITARRSSNARGGAQRASGSSDRSDLAPLTEVERSRAADEWTFQQEKSQETVRILRNADSFALPDFAGFLVIMSEPQWTFSAKIEPIEPTINPQRRGEPSWSSRRVG